MLICAEQKQMQLCKKKIIKNTEQKQHTRTYMFKHPTEQSSMQKKQQQHIE